MGSKGQYLKEIYQTLLTNKKQGNLDYVHATNIFSQRKLALTARNTLFTFIQYKIIGATKKFKKRALPAKLTTNHTCHQKPNPSRETVPLNSTSIHSTCLDAVEQLFVEAEIQPSPRIIVQLLAGTALGQAPATR